MEQLEAAHAMNSSPAVPPAVPAAAPAAPAQNQQELLTLQAKLEVGFTLHLVNTLSTSCDHVGLQLVNRSGIEICNIYSTLCLSHSSTV